MRIRIEFVSMFKFEISIQRESIIGFFPFFFFFFFLLLFLVVLSPVEHVLVSSSRFKGSGIESVVTNKSDRRCRQCTD